MSLTQLAFQRLFQQRLTRDGCASPAEVVNWLGAVQAQDYLGAKWSLGMRMENATDDLIERAFNAGDILRTHMMRPTWHFVSPEDIRWIQALTSPRVHAGNAYMYRTLNLDDALLLRCNDEVARALEGGRQLTRAELGAALAQKGIEADSMRLGYIIHHAELDAVVCSGPRRGKQFTYMLLSERAPRARTLPRDEALVELTRRYFTGHGPASLHDLAWWSGLTLSDVRLGVEMAADELTSEEIDGQKYYASTAQSPTAEPSTQAFLLPTYDELLIGYANFDRSRTAGQELQGQMVFDSTIHYGGRIIGTWRRTLQRKSVIIELAPFQRFTSQETEAVEAAAQRYGRFIGLPVECMLAEPRDGSL